MPSSFKQRFKEAFVGLQIAALLFMPVNSAHADGLTGGVVVDGAASITAGGGVTTINQSTQNAIINWQSFSIGTGEAANFNMPSINSAVLNRVTGNDLSTIAGQMNANGNVYLINPNGVLFTNGALVNVGGLTASTLDVSNQQFMQGGTLNFSGTSNAGVFNNGEINAITGDINFFALDVQNNGTLNAPNGVINLGAGHDVELHKNGSYTVTGANGSVQVLNTGVIDGGRAVLTAGAGSSAMNVTVEKATMIVKQNGRVYLGSPSSTIEMTGGAVVRASDGASPNVAVNAAETVITNTDITASAAAGGGSVTIGGTDADNLIADSVVISGSSVDVSSTEAGDGGQIIIWSRQLTDIATTSLNANGGPLAGNGGFIETSSAGTVAFGGGVNVSAAGPLGSGGLWLIDPTDMTFTAAAAAAATTTLDGGTNVTVSTLGAGGDVGNIFIDPVTVMKTAGGAATLAFIANNDIEGSGFTFTGTNLSVVLNADFDGVGRGAVDIDGAAIDIGGTFVAFGSGGPAGGIGVDIETSALTARDLRIIGVGGGPSAAMTLRPLVAGSADAGSAIAAAVAFLTDGNHGVSITDSSVMTTTGDLDIIGFGGLGLSNNDGVNISDTPIHTDAGNINIVGRGGGADAEAIQGRGPSWILEDSDGMVNTLFEQGWDDAAVAAFGTMFGDGNDGVRIDGANVLVNSDYVEPANIRDINNYFVTGEFPGGTFEYDFAVGRDDLNRAGARHPDARHILIDGIGGIGDGHRGVSLESLSQNEPTVTVTSTSADIHLLGTGGGMPDAYVRGLIETSKDLTPFVGSDRVANTGVVTTGTLITAIADLYGDDNTGVDLQSATGINITADAAAPTGGETRTVKEVGGNIFIEGTGGKGQARNVGVNMVAALTIDIISEIGNIDIEGNGGGPSENVFVMDPGNDRVDTLLEVDFSAADLDAFIAEIWAPAIDNHGVSMTAGTSIAVTSNFEEPPALRRFQDGTFGFGYLEPDATYTTDDATTIGDLVLVNSLPHDKGGIGLYLLPDASGTLVPVDNQVNASINDYSTDTNAFGDPNPNGPADGFDVEGPNTQFGIPVVQQRRVDIVGMGGNGTSNNDGLNFVSASGQNITSLAADLNLVGNGGGIPDALTKSIIENAQDIHPYVGSDRINDVTTIGDVIAGTDLIMDIGDLYGIGNDGIFMNDPLNVTVRTTLTPTMIWDGANALSTTADHARPLGTDGSELVRLLTPGGLVDTALTDLKDADVTAFGDGIDNPADMAGNDTDAKELFAQKQRIAKAGDNIIATSRVSRADINIIGTGGKGQGDNDGIHINSGLLVNIQALQFTASDAGNITIVGTGGGIPAGGVGFNQSNPSGNVIATDHVMSRLAGGNVTGNGITDNLFEADLVESDMAALATTIFGDDNHGVHIVSGTGTNITSTFDEPFVGPGRWVYMDWFTDQMTETSTMNGTFPSANGNDLKMFVNTESDEDFGVPIVAWRTVEITGRGGTGIGDNKGIDIDATIAINVITRSANIDLNGFGGGMPDAVVHSMVENATEQVTHLNEPGDINDRIQGMEYGAFTSTFISNADLLSGIATAYGDGNKGIELTAGTFNSIQAVGESLRAWNSHVGNISITGYGGPGASMNKGVEFTASDIIFVQTALGNIDIDGLGGGIAAGDLVSGFSNPLFGDVISIDPSSDLLVDQLLERDLDDTDIGLFAGFGATLGMNKGVEFIAGTSNSIASTYAEPINIRDLQGRYLSGEYIEHSGNDSGLFMADAAGGSIVHPLARFVTILGAGGHGADLNEGVKFSSATATTIESNSADIIIDGFGGGVPNRVVQSLIENAKDVAFNVPGGTTDRTDGMGNIGHAAVANGADGIEVAALNATVVDALVELYGDGNKGIFASTVTSFNVLANANPSDANNFTFESRTQNLVGGNITMFGRGGTGQSDNMGIHTSSVTSTNIVAGLGNIRIDGAGGGMPSGDPNLLTPSYPDVVFAAVPNSSSDSQQFGPAEFDQHIGVYRPNNRLAASLPQLENHKDGNQSLPIQDTSVELIGQQYTGLIGDLAKNESDVGGNVFGIQHSGNFRTDRLLEVDFVGADIDKLVDDLWAPTSNNTGVRMDAVTSVNITSEFKEPPALRRFIVDVDASGVIDAADFDANGDPIRVTYGFGYFEPTNIANGIDTSLATNKGDLVLVDSNLQGNHLIVDKYGNFVPVYNQTPIAVNDNGVNVINLPSNAAEFMPGSFAVNGDPAQGILLSDGGVNVGDQGITNGVDGSFSVDGPGLGYQDGIPVVQQRAVNIVGVGGYGKADNKGVDINTVTSINITTTAADLVIDGLGGGIASPLTKSIIENVADVHPFNLSGGFTDRINDMEGATGGVMDLIRSEVAVQEMDTTDLIAAIGRLYGDSNTGVETESVTSTTIETNLTATTIWPSTKITEADVLQDLGPTGGEMIELPASLGGGMVTIDTLKDVVVDNQAVGSEDIQKVKHDAAKAGDNIIVTSRISRGDLAIYGEGGRGKSDNLGVDINSVLSLSIETKSSVGGDAGNLTIHGVGGGIPSGGLALGSNPNPGSALGIGPGQSVAAANVIATDHVITHLSGLDTTGNGITDNLLEADFAGTDMEDLANMVFGDGNNGVEITSPLAITIKSHFEEPFMAPGRWKYIDWFMDQSTEMEYVPNGNDLKMFVNVEEEGSDVPIIGYRNLQIVGKGGTGKGDNKGIFVSTPLAINIETISANLKLDGEGGGIPDQVVHSMIENATDIITHLDDADDINDRINDRMAISNIDLIRGIEAIYGDDNMGLHFSSALAINVKSTDDTLASWNAYVGNIDIDGTAGPGQSDSHGTHFTAGTAVNIESGVGNIDIQGIGGGLPAGDLVGTRSQGGIDNPLFNDVITIGSNNLIDRLLERDFADADFAEFTSGSDLFGDDNRGLSFVAGTGVNIHSDYIENASVRDIHNVVQTGEYAVGTTGMFAAEYAGGSNPHPLARELNIKGFGGIGTDDNRGIFYSTVTFAGIDTESADIWQSGYGGGVPEYVFNSMVINGKDTTPRAGLNVTDGVLGVGAGGILNGPLGNGTPLAATNSQLITSFNDLLGSNNKGIHSSNVTAFNTIAHANTPDGLNFIYETRTKKEVGGNIRMLGYGGIGQDDNTGIHLSTVLSVNIEADYGNIDIDGIGGGVPGGPNNVAADARPNRGIFSINGNGVIDGLLEADMDDAEIDQFVADIYGTAENNDGFRTNTVTATNIKSNFKEPPALRQYADGTYGYGYYNPNDATDRGILVMVGSEGEGRYLVVDKYGALQHVAHNPAIALNDNGNDNADIRTPGVAVVQERSVDITGIGGTGVRDNQGVNFNTVTSINVETLAATINMEGIGGGMETAVVRSLVENGADVTPNAGRDRTADFSSDRLGTPFVSGGGFGVAIISDGLADIDQFINVTGTPDAHDGIRDGLPSDPISVFNVNYLADPSLIKDLIETPVDVSTLIDAYRDLYGADNDGILLNSVTSTNIKTTLTPELVWDGSTKVTDPFIFPGSAPDVLQPLGTDGSEMVMGMRADMLPGATRAEYARETDNLIVTANRSRADIHILGIGGRGDDNNRGVEIDAVTAINIQALNTADSLQDGGNITINAIGGGIPSGAQFGPRANAGGINTPFATQSFAQGGLSATQLSGTGTGGDSYNGRDANFIVGNVCLRTITNHNNVVDNVMHIDGNGLTDTLLEVAMGAADLPRIAADVMGRENDGFRTTSVAATTIESAFIEPFVPVLPDGSPVHLNGDGPLVASRDIIINGQAGVGVDDNKGINIDSAATIDIKSVSANIRLDGLAGGAPEIVARNMISNGATNGIANSVIIDAVNDLYGPDNMGTQLDAAAAVTVESTDTRVSAPNSRVGNVAIIGEGGPGSDSNIGVDLHSGAAVTVRSGVGNVAVVGDAGGLPTSIVIGTDPGIDSFNELPGLTPMNIVAIGDGYGDDNHGVHTLAPAVTIESLYEEPNLGDPGIGAAHAYSFRNGMNKANPFFLRSTMPVSKASPRTDSSEGFVRVDRLEIPEILAGQNGAGSNGLVEGREVVIAGRGGTGQSSNKGVFLQGGASRILSIDADVDVDGVGGGIPDAVVAALNAAHVGPGFDTRISQLYGTVNHGVQIIGPGSGIQISDEGDMEVNGIGGQGYAMNKGILIIGANVYEAEEGDIILVGTGGGILETFNPEYDASGGNPGLREANHGIQIGGASIIESKFDAQSSDDPYEMKMEGLLLLDGLVGNNAGLGNANVGEVYNIIGIGYEHDLGGPITDDAGILIHGVSSVLSADADIDLFAVADLLVRNRSTVEASEDGDLAAVASRHLEVSGGSLINTSGTKANGDRTLTTVAWDQFNTVFDSLGRLKVDATSGIGATMGDGETRLYGSRRGSDPQPFGTNMMTSDGSPYGPAYNNEIDAGATFNGIVWTDVQSDPPTVSSGDHIEEFCTWENEQWNTAFDWFNRRAVTDSDRFATTQAPSAYNFGNPASSIFTGGVAHGTRSYEDNFVFYYTGWNSKEAFPLPDYCQLFPFSCYLREGVGPLTYSQMMDSVFGANGYMEYGGGWEGATGGAMGTGGFGAFLGNEYNVTGPNGNPIRFESMDSLTAFFAEEPAGTYFICGNGNEETGCVTYDHKPEDAMWQQNLQEAVEGILPVPRENPTVGEPVLDIDLSLSAE